MHGLLMVRDDLSYRDEKTCDPPVAHSSFGVETQKGD